MSRLHPRRHKAGTVPEEEFWLLFLVPYRCDFPDDGTRRRKFQMLIDQLENIEHDLEGARYIRKFLRDFPTIADIEKARADGFDLRGWDS